METNGKNWLPQTFIKQMLGYLSGKEKSTLAEVHSSLAKQIIRGNESLRVVHAKSDVVLQWVELELTRWKEIASQLIPNSTKKADELRALSLVCTTASLEALLGSDGAWLAIDTNFRLQAVAVAEYDPDAESHELHQLVTAPWNLWRETNEPLPQDLPNPIRGAATLLTAAIARRTNRPLDLTPLRDAIPFYERLGFQPNDSSHHRLTSQRAKTHLGHLTISWMKETELVSHQSSHPS